MKLITLENLQQLIDKIGIKCFFTDVIQCLQRDFSRWQEFHKNPRHVLHDPRGVIELMPIADQQFYAVKYVNGHPFNPLNKKLTVVALGLLVDMPSGYPLMISEMTLLTAVRTACVSALASSYLAKPNPKILALIGTGAQAEFQTLAHHIALGINCVRYFDIDKAAMDKFAKNLIAFPSLQLIRCQNARDAINNADIITTATANKKITRILQDEDIRDGMHINAIGGDCFGKTELDVDILQRARIVVEYLPQAQQEGEIQHIDPKKVYAELWELVQGKKSGRYNETEITIFDSVGFALEDFSILKYVYEKSLLLSIGEEVPMVPQLDNPKDLFSLLAPTSSI